jgi:hypothetical protein
LSLISRTISDIRISSQIEQSSRAFSAAEAGIESALTDASTASTEGTVTLPGASASYTVQSVGGASDPLVFPYTQPSEVQTVWLIDHDADGNINSSGYSYPSDSSLTICWGTVSGSTPAIITSFYFRSGTALKVAKIAFDADSARGNGFEAADAAVGNTCPTGYAFMKTVTLGSLGITASDVPYLMRVSVVYSGTALAVVPASTIALPVQSKLITSIGQSETGVVRRIQVSQGFTVLPPLLDFALFSEN